MNIRKAYSFDDVLIVPKYNKIKSRQNVVFKTKVTRNHDIDIPLVIANMDTICESTMAIAVGKLGGLGVIHRFLTIEEQANEIRKVKESGLLTAAALGVKDYEERLAALDVEGVDIIVLDIAHGHSESAKDALLYIKDKYPAIDVMCGNIASKEAAQDLLDWGADAIKVGVGPGSMCTTRIMTGCGVPQLTAIDEVYQVVGDQVPICADGGIKQAGDIVKAIGAGADNVMIGSLVSGTVETPGDIVQVKGKPFKIYRGMASFDAAIQKLEKDNQKTKEVISIEGEKTKVPFRGPVQNIIKKLLGGLASGMTYNGVLTIDKLKANVEFVEITTSGLYESKAHGLVK
ncbi:guanosine monophosphate reductase [Aureibacter tunicatorum]|uniref:IMP dehydrogenase n=1 Tax=Aureibacter tunicatorum TaxID=866807 RepID=A0AAE3XTH7_9BACT|nr:IMP dehydrogenase [Aureibacter tunicatorum]MDR6241709.1 IMP dehydrogenase [Aureibacter tunicatorum]BDD07306.1 guanosine monophosphate reductase [Aureibacter tunicatorum]